MLYIKKMYHIGQSRALVIPPAILRSRGWEKDEYFIFDDRDPDILIIRRLISVEECIQRKREDPNSAD
jgi:bifunctional DNA-binding transcriptional regulator/antitoxin component of YhaV-PrlF toxin-antitoxin module